MRTYRVIAPERGKARTVCRFPTRASAERFCRRLNVTRPANGPTDRVSETTTPPTRSNRP